MGFHAPSADDVYRYAFRLDRPDRGLVDRFGWSILVVNDNSAVCREFLARYCADLCVRTADRVRFVFFSDLPEGRFERMAFDAARAGPRATLLGSVLEKVIATDFERDPWRVLRPAALHPLIDISAIRQHVDRQCDQNTAMPGAGEALRFAQRLGIGRHVPCVLVFTDVGSLSMRVLPFAGRTADQVYDHLRGWIDDFYAENRAALARWWSVEEDIERLVGRSEQALHTVRTWNNGRLEAWRNLRRILAARTTLDTDPEAGLRELSIIAADYHVPWQVRSRLQDISAARARRAARAALAEQLDDLGRQTQPEKIRSALRVLDQARSVDLSPQFRALVREALAELTEQPRLIPPRTQLFQWWRTTAQSVLSKAAYRRQRLTWPWDESTTVLAESRHRDRLRLEFATFQEAIGRGRLGDDDAATAVFAALAALYETPADSPAWTAATAAHRESLTTGLRRLAATAPRWLFGLEIRDFLPLGGASDPDTFKAFVASSPRLSAALPPDRVDPAPSAEAHLHHRDRVRDALRTEVGRLPVATGEDDGLRPLLASLHADLTAAARSRAFPGDDTVTVEQADLATVPRLAEALEEYDRAIAGLRFPHERDPVLVPVETALSPAEAAHLRPPAPPAHAGDQLAKVVATAREAHELLPRARRDAQRWRLAGKLTDELSAAMDPAELAAVLPTDPSSISADELASLRRHLPPAADPLLAALTATTPSASTEPAESFDVFLAHHSDDKPAVHELHRQLLSRGLNPWIDVERIRPGQWFQDAIQSGILQSKTATICIGPSGLGRWQAAEINAFLHRCIENGVPVIPVLLPGAEKIPAELVFLQGLHHVRFTTDIHEKTPLDNLIWGITGRRTD
ncbi:toll/interleukin-1 receptor domain-containing protein [Paractinoplanes durhamensis]|uniref:TIR domain-containing protein n=1 Tax=Paractinoplanes durhamensis TaxID=113563 RepID=A0ABQ3Z3I3_9ACTN|nr:toll/interleukin-1 receptor domain-containing protein [Actinoplanes durhamensis]GIE04369.1 hypothetical protein Adu01nite_57190 [Actinoplanes durhamensis]